MHVLAAALATVVGLSLPAATLNGDPRVFPRDAGLPRSIFVVTFSKAASVDASEWTHNLRNQQDKLKAEIFQVAVLENVPRLIRSFVVSALAREVPDRLHDHFWVAVTASADWQESVDSTSPDEPHVFVLDARENLVWRAHGQVSDVKVRELLDLPPPGSLKTTSAVDDLSPSRSLQRTTPARARGYCR